MGIKIVHHHLNDDCVREMDIHEIAHAIRKIDRRAPRGDFDLPPTRMGSGKQEEIAGSFATVFVIMPRDLSGCRRDDVGDFTDDLVGTLIETDSRS